VHLLKPYFAVEDASDPPLAECVRHGVEQLGLDTTAIAPYVVAVLTGRIEEAALQRMAPQALRQRTFAALHALFLAVSRQQPLVVAVEDPHWIDHLSDAFLAVLGGSLGAMPIMLLLSYRPDFHHGWAEKSYYTQIAPHPLRDVESGALMASVLRVSAIPPDLALITRKAEGNQRSVSGL
jgi:predicted ATPase